MNLRVSIRLGDEHGTLEGLEEVVIPLNVPPSDVYTRLLQPVTRLGELVCVAYRSHLEQSPPLESLEEL
jgi:hypothetical protein